MGKYLKDRMIKVLCESNDLWEAYDFMARGEERAVDMQAMELLVSKGYLNKGGDGIHRTTLAGLEYLEELTTWYPYYWFKQNWLPATVALATFISSVTSVVSKFI